MIGMGIGLTDDLPGPLDVRFDEETEDDVKEATCRRAVHEGRGQAGGNDQILIRTITESFR
jgi:hypothetical protein